MKNYPSDGLPFSVSTRSWEELNESERSFFCFQDEYLPLHPNHGAQIHLLLKEDANRFTNWVWSSIPSKWPEPMEYFKYNESLVIQDSWNDETARTKVKRWLYDKNIPLKQTVYLLYNKDHVVQTTWRMVIRYWDAFAWLISYQMIVVNHTLSWACCFHHEDIIIFGHNYKIRRSR
jgi:hypothetical protein